MGELRTSAVFNHENFDAGVDAMLDGMQDIISKIHETSAAMDDMSDETAQRIGQVAEKMQEFSEGGSKDMTLLQEAIDNLDASELQTLYDELLKLFDSDGYKMGEFLTSIGIKLPSSMQAGAAGVTSLAVAEGAATVATEALEAALTFGLNIAITAIVGTLTALYAKWRDQKKLMEEIASISREGSKEYAFEASELTRLFDKLNDVTENTQGYLDVKNEIIEKYGKYDATLKEEGLTIDELKGKYEALSVAILESANNRMYDTEAQTLIDNFDKNFGKKSDKLYEIFMERKNATDEQNLNTYKLVQRMVREGKSADDIMQHLSGFTNNKKKRVRNLITDLIEGQKELNEGLEEARNKYSIGANSARAVQTEPQEDDDNGTKALNAKAKDIERAWTAFYQKQAELDNKARQAEIDLMEDGLDKTLAQIDFETDMKVEAIEKEREEVRAQYRELGLELSQAEEEGFANRITVAQANGKQRKDKAESDSQKALDDENMRRFKQYQSDLAAYSDYVRKKMELDKTLAESISRVDASNMSDGAKQTEKESIYSQYNAQSAILSSSLSEGVQQILVDEKGWLRGMVDMSIEELQILVNNVSAELNAVGHDTEAAAKARAKLLIASQALNEAQVQASEKEAQDAKEKEERYESLVNTLGNVADAADALNSALGDVLSDAARQSLSTIATIADGTIGVINGIKLVADTSATAISAVEKASIILGVIATAVQVLTAIVSLIQNTLSKSAQTQKQIDRYNEQLHDLQRSQKKFEDSLDSKVGEDYWRTLYKAAESYDEQIANLEAQRELAAQKVSEVHGKKRKAEAQEQLEDIEDALQSTMSNQRSMWDSFFSEMLTTDVTSFANGIADAMLDAAQDGAEGISSAFDDSVDNLVRSMMKAQLSRQITSLFEPAFNEMRNLASDGVLSEDDIAQTVAMLNQNKAQAVAMVQAVDDYMEAAGMNSGAKASSGGLATITESTASELNGRFTDIQYKMAQIAASISSTFGNGMLLTAVTDIQANVDASREHLSDIAKYTRSLEAMSGALDRISKKVERL